jgi:hypothetical protein
LGGLATVSVASTVLQSNIAQRIENQISHLYNIQGEYGLKFDTNAPRIILTFNPLARRSGQKDRSNWLGCQQHSTSRSKFCYGPALPLSCNYTRWSEVWMWSNKMSGFESSAASSKRCISLAAAKGFMR